MPTVGAFHEQYWNNDRHTHVVTPPPTVSNGGYPVWQASVISGVVFGPPLDPLKRCWRWLVFLWRAVCIAARVPIAGRAAWLIWAAQQAASAEMILLATLPAPERAVYRQVEAMIASEHWPAALAAVQRTWTTPKFNDDQLWKAMSVKVRQDRGAAQRLFRHLHAVQALQDAGVTVPVADLHFLLEAAYQAWAAVPKRTV